jgi:hypothetical protein
MATGAWNPLVAPRSNAPPNPWTGVRIAEDIQLIIQGIENRSWVDTTLGTVSASLDALALRADPVGVLVQYGVSWLIEHVKPLTRALDLLAGDPRQIAAHAQTWRNVAGSLRDSACDLDFYVWSDVPEWTGDAADSYRAWSREQQGSINALALGADAMAIITEVAGALVAGVRTMVRDFIASLVSQVIKRVLGTILSGAAPTALVVREVGGMVATTASNIARVINALVTSLNRLQLIVYQLRALIVELKKLLDQLGSQPPAPRPALPPGPRPILPPYVVKPSRPPDPAARPRGSRTKEVTKGHKRENEAAETLAKHGYDVEQNPPAKPNGKEPDYRIEGEYFDCIAPETNNMKNVWDRMQGKVTDGQAERLVLNLDNSTRTAAEYAEYLRREPVNGLQQVLVVKDGAVTQIYP